MPSYFLLSHPCFCIPRSLPLAHLTPDSMTNAVLDTRLPCGLFRIRQEIAAEMFTLPISAGTSADCKVKMEERDLCTWSMGRG